MGDPQSSTRHDRNNAFEARTVAVSPPTAANSATPGAFSKQTTHSIAPFLSKHIPNQYAPLGGPDMPKQEKDRSNTKYCYRHHPDLKCRRQANEPSMEQLQNELATLPQGDQEGIAHVWSLFAAAPSKHRDLMLQGILAQCCFPQLSSISAAVRDLIKIDFLAALPAELGLRILSFLDPTSICKAAQVSERWRVLADDDVVWHRMCEQHIDRKCTKCGIGLPLLDQKRLRTEKRQIQLRATGQNSLDDTVNTDSQGASSIVGESGDPASAQNLALPRSANHRKRLATEPLPSPTTSIKRLCTDGASPAPTTGTLPQDSYLTQQPQRQPWKAVYRERHRIGANWKYGRCSIRTFKGHTNGVMALQFDDHILASGSYDSTIKIWDVETGAFIRTLTGHTLGVRCLQFSNSRLASGSLDGTVKIWDLDTGKLLSDLPGHTGGVIGLHFDGLVVASGSVDTTVRVWNFADKQQTVLRGHTDWVNSVKIDTPSQTLLSASDDCTVKLWDLGTRRCIRTFHGHVAPVQQVVPLPPEFELQEPGDGDDGRDDERITPAPPDLSEPSDSPFRYPSPSTDDSTPPSPSADTTTTTPRPLPPRYMLTGSLDLTIRLWDVHRGTCLRRFFGHVEGIWALAADTLRVVSGANDGMVKLWDPRSGKCERTFAGHAGPVTCVGLSDRRMATGSEDHEVRLYSFCA